MNELKTYDSKRIYWAVEREADDIEGLHLDDNLFYIKSDVEKTITDLEAENKRLKRALWLARAYRAEARKNYWYVRCIHECDERRWSIDGSAVKYLGCIKRTNFEWLKIWSEIEIKCHNKAKAYK